MRESRGGREKTNDRKAKRGKAKAPDGETENEKMKWDVPKKIGVLLQSIERKGVAATEVQMLVMVTI